MKFPPALWRCKCTHFAKNNSVLAFCLSTISVPNCTHVCLSVRLTHCLSTQWYLCWRVTVPPFLLHFVLSLVPSLFSFSVHLFHGLCVQWWPILVSILALLTGMTRLPPSNSTLLTGKSRCVSAIACVTAFPYARFLGTAKEISISQAFGSSFRLAHVFFFRLIVN